MRAGKPVADSEPVVGRERLEFAYLPVVLGAVFNPPTLEPWLSPDGKWTLGTEGSCGAEEGNCGADPRRLWGDEGRTGAEAMRGAVGTSGGAKGLSGLGTCTTQEISPSVQVHVELSKPKPKEPITWTLYVVPSEIVRSTKPPGTLLLAMETVTSSSSWQPLTVTSES